MQRAASLILLALAVGSASATDTKALANPIRKVVTLLQKMQKKVEAEGKKEAELYEKFMCYCKNGAGDLAASISAAETKGPQVMSDIKEAEAKLEQTKADLKQAQVDRSAAEAAMAEATAIREKEAAAYASAKADYDANIGAITKAVAALESGMAGSFLQTADAGALRTLVLNAQDMLDVDRQEVASFLAGSQEGGYAPASGEITGILKQMGATLKKGLADITATETEARGTYSELIAAKKKEVAALSAAIEAKTPQIGELGIAIVQMKEDVDDTAKALEEDKKFLAGLEESCKTKTAEWEERSKTRGEELVALADTIKILNDDDALELFKKTLPGASSFMQVSERESALQGRALAAIRDARSKADHKARPGLDLLALALSGKKADFGKVIQMCDEMVAVLKKEQQDDSDKKEYCEGQFDTAEDKKKVLELDVSDAENAIATTKESVATLTEEIAALEAGIKALDKSVAEATEQRKEESEDYEQLMTSDTAAKEILGFAKNRLNKFYNPKLYKPPAKEELSRADRISANMGGAAVLVQVAEHKQEKEAPAPPPATWDAYAKKSEESTGVIAMVDLLVKDLDKEMIEAKQAEKDAQADYETLMADSAEKRAADSKSLTEKGSAKAQLEGELEAHKGARDSGVKELMAVEQYIASIHAECDWLIQYYDVRREARTGEIDSLVKAKAVLSGADFSLVQTGAARLRR